MLRTHMTRHHIRRFALLGASCALLGGCGLPPSLQVASWAVDGISYLATDKSVADHGLSALSGQDCKIMRVASAAPVCQKHPGGVDFNGNLDVHAARVSTNLPACMTAQLAQSLSDSPQALSGCAAALVEKFGSNGAMNFADARILALIDAGRMDDAGLWYGVQATVRAFPTANDAG